MSDDTCGKLTFTMRDSSSPRSLEGPIAVPQLEENLSYPHIAILKL
jgi:hypothetical protein